jgi:uncharacterized protein DUF5666
MKRVLLIALFSSVVFALAITGCGGSSTPPFQATGTSTTIQMGDATDPAIVKFELTISAITLTGVSPTATTGNLLAKPAEFEFAHTAGTLEPVTLGNIPAGTYSAATLTVSNPEVVVVNGTTPTKVPATLSSGTINVTLNPSLTVTSAPLFLNFDLDLAKSVTLTGTNPITGATVNPTFTVTSTSTPPAGNEGNEDHDNGEIEDVHGKVTAITAPSFTIDTGNATITFATDSNTKFKDGITQLSDLKVGDIVEVDGMTKADGSKLATKVEREGGSNGHEVEGVISALDSPLTKITVAHQVDSDNSNANSAPVTVDVTVNSSTVFSVRGDKLSVTGTFDATHIGKGQRIEADANATATPIVATKVKLREQALVGTVAAAPAPTASAFTLTIDPASAFGKLSGATSVAVTFASGSKVLVTPAAGATVRVRGLVFVNGTTYTMTAVRGDDNK